MGPHLNGKNHVKTGDLIIWNYLCKICVVIYFCIDKENKYVFIDKPMQYKNVIESKIKSKTRQQQTFHDTH